MKNIIQNIICKRKIKTNNFIDEELKSKSDIDTDSDSDIEE